MCAHVSLRSRGTLVQVVIFTMLLFQLEHASAMDTNGDTELDANELGRQLRETSSQPAELGEFLGNVIIAATDGNADDVTKVMRAVAQTLEGVGGSLVKRPKRETPVVDADDNDAKCAMLLLRNVRSFFATALSSMGRRFTVLQDKVSAIAEALFSQDIVGRRMLSSVERLTGMSRTQFIAGGRVQAQNAELPRTAQILGVQRARRSDAVSLDWIWEWFHTKSGDVEPDKSTKCKYSRKKAYVAGEMRNLTCDMRILTCLKCDAVKNFKASVEYKSFTTEFDIQICDETVSQCICPCMKPDKREECACPNCTAMQHRLKAWRSQRSEWHKNGTCTCGLDCKNPESFWRRVSCGFSGFEEALLCSRQPHYGLVWPHASTSVPEFRRLNCCLLPRSAGRHLPDGPIRQVKDPLTGVTTDVQTPREPCSKCGWANMFYPHSDTENRCKDEYNDEPATWKKKKKIDVGKGKLDDRFVDHTGTRAELLLEIEDNARDFFYHRWGIAWTRWQFKLDIATFDGRTSILVLTDFAAVYEMKGKEVGTCEHGISSHQLVALVLFNPGPIASGDGSEREVKCDYWRVWSNQKGNATFHDMAMRDIARHYLTSGKVPDLQSIKIWSDGQRAQYKGEKNFGRVVEWPNVEDDGGMEMDMEHNFFMPHHASGPQDNAGKDPRRAMDKAIIYNKTHTIYDYGACFEWCSLNMTQPSIKHDHRGTWGGNGDYIWRAYSNGKFQT
jgi:hypothetical protein